MNDDLISRDAFLKRMMRTNRYFDVKFDIMEEPAVDAVIPVRCKDCKHLMFSDCYGECRIGHIGIVQPDDFCSRGERRANYE